MHSPIRYAGVDWATRSHAVCVVDERGTIVERFEVEHRDAGLRAVTFRFACDKKLRDALLDFAEDSRFASPWAAAIYQRAITDRKTHPHAARILARAWTYVLWRCWQDRVPYDPARHRALQGVLRATAA